MRTVDGIALRVAIVIVHYKTPGLLKECVATVLPEMAGDRLVIVDNDSGEADLAEIRELGKLAGVTLIETGRNAGFAGGNNVGIERVMAEGRPEFILLLNPDTLVRPGAIGVMVDYLREHREAALVGPRLEFLDGEGQLSAFGDHCPMSEFVRGANIGPVSRMLKRWEVYGERREETHRAEWLSGACVLMRTEVVEEIGMLDAGYFMYFEETDFFRRARKAGFAAWYVPEARVVHLVGRASGVTGDMSGKRLPGYWFESRHRYFRKHFGYVGMLMADVMYMAGCGLNRVRRMLTGVSHSSVAKGEVRDFLRHSFRQMRRVRMRGA